MLHAHHVIPLAFGGDWVAGGRNWHQHLEDLDFMRGRRFSVVR
jgi:hypothetical protein